MNSGIYKITHLDSGRIYIGQTTNIKRRLRAYKNNGGSGNSNSVIKRAILKYGWNAFKFEVMLYAAGYEYLNRMEQKAIVIYESLAPKGFNILLGGDNYAMAESTKKLLSESKKGRVTSEEVKEKLRIAGKNRWANATQEELDANKERARNINLGKKLSAEVREKLSKSRKEGYANGTIKKVTPWLGKKMSDETRKKISEAGKSRIATPEFIENCRQAALKRWAKRKGV